MQEVTLVFLVRREKGKISDVLLAMKKRGFGEGKWNGYGGKFDPQLDSDIISSAVRECREEADVKVKDLRKVAEIEFEFSDKEGWDQRAHVYLCEDWEGDPVETEEMRPEWFKVDKVPYEQMWSDDIFWLPLVLKDESLKAMFVFSGEGKVVSQEIKVGQNFEGVV